MITVHHLENSRSQRVLWLLEELGLPYQVIRYQRDKQTMLAPDALKLIHPLGKSPLIEDDGVVFAETGAIVEHLVGKGDGRLGVPQEPEAANLYRFWLHYAEGSLMPVLFTKLVLRRVPVLGKIAARRFQPMIDVHLDYVESALRQSPWFAGMDMSAADIMMSFPLEAARSRAGLDHSRPATIAWLAKVHERPAYRRALQQGGPYAYA
ncbi:glutathione S-transferase family protein [Sphingomonas sp.]|uniref:glutathione S-transferase family protein n=1 Tax=Sphingomonas sp. TaxID=28214 RepID=UPI003B3A1529